MISIVTISEKDEQAIIQALKDGKKSLKFGGVLYNFEDDKIRCRYIRAGKDFQLPMIQERELINKGK